MPHFFGKYVAVYQHELVPAFWSTADSLRVEIWRKRDLDYGIKQLQKGGNGRKMRVDFDSLPIEIQRQLKDPRKPDHILETYFTIDPEAVKFYGSFKRPNYGFLKLDESEKYIVNASVIQALIRLESDRTTERLNKGGSIRASKDVKSVAETILEDSISFQAILRSKGLCEHNLPTHPRRFRAKIQEFKDNKYICLIKDPEGASISNAKKVDDQIINLLNNLFSTQSHKPTATEVARQYEGFLSGYVEIINNKTGEVYNPFDFKPISKSTVKAYLAKWENRPANEFKRDNDRQKLMTKHIPYSKLEQPRFAGSIISIDDRQPPFKYPSGASGKRLWFYVGIDLASQAIICWVHGKTKEGLIKNFYQQLVRNYHEWGVNLPDGLECESSLNSAFKDTFLRNGAMFQDVRIEANSARSKRIEAYFRPLRYGLEKKREGWIARPHALSEANQQSQKPAPLIPYDDIVIGCLQDIVTWNNTAHNLDSGISRWDYFTQNQNPNLKPTNYTAILPHLGNYTKSSCKAGIIKLNGGEWLIAQNDRISLGDELIQTMKLVETKDVDIYWLDDNNGEVIKAMIFSGDGRLICQLLPMPVGARAKIEETPAHREAKAIVDSYKMTVASYFKREKNNREALTIIDNRPTTLNNNFTIPGLNKFQPQIEDVEDLGYDNDDQDDQIFTPLTSSSEAWANNFKI